MPEISTGPYNESTSANRQVTAHAASCTRCNAWGGSADARVDHPANTDTGSTPVKHYIWCN